MSRRLVDRSVALLQRRSTRRGFLVKAAVVGSALAAVPTTYLLRPGSAYAAVCGPASTCSAGWSVFCCTLYRGMNKCPPGTFVGGWWKTDNSVYCCEGGQRRARYILDCHPHCECRSGCPPFCSASCTSCSCRCHDDRDGCDNRRNCCNNFRYGQCNQHIGCSGPVACRVATCTPPYRLYETCGSTSATDNRTVDHHAPCLGPRCA